MRITIHVTQDAYSLWQMQARNMLYHLYEKIQILTPCFVWLSWEQVSEKLFVRKGRWNNFYTGPPVSLLPIPSQRHIFYPFDDFHNSTNTYCAPMTPPSSDRHAWKQPNFCYNLKRLKMNKELNYIPHRTRLKIPSLRLSSCMTVHWASFISYFLSCRW